jgi:hypothetical protein
MRIVNPTHFGQRICIAATVSYWLRDRTLRGPHNRSHFLFASIQEQDLSETGAGDFSVPIDGLIQAEGFSGAP